MQVILSAASVRSWIRRELRVNADEYDDCGELNRTKLGEDALAALGWDREHVPAFVWDVAHDVATAFEA